MKRPKLFLLHFAGGSSYSFQFLAPLLPEFEFIPLELPGRGRRMHEDLLDTFEEAVDDIVGQIVRAPHSGCFVIYGHSMGSIIALKAASILESINMFPRYVIVSGTPAPGAKVIKKRYELTEDDFKTELKAMGGIPDEILSNDELYDFFAPVIRADFKVVENSDLSAFPAIRSPILALMGSEEEDVSEIDSWKKFSTSGVESSIMEGDHFFIYRHSKKISEMIKCCVGDVLIRNYNGKIS